MKKIIIRLAKQNVLLLKCYLVVKFVKELKKMIYTSISLC